MAVTNISIQEMLDIHPTPDSINLVMQSLMVPVHLPTINLTQSDITDTTYHTVVVHPHGDLIEAIKHPTTPLDIVIQCCNCFHVMGKGIALALRTLFPEVLEVDKQSPKGLMAKLGTYTTALSNTQHTTIVNLYGQYNYGHRQRFLCYKALRLGLDRLLQQICIQIPDEQQRRSLRIGTYWLGCSNAGGSQSVVKFILEQVFRKWNMTIHIYTGN